MHTHRHAYPRIVTLTPATGWYVIYDGIEPNTPVGMWALVEDKDGRYDQITTRIEGIDAFDELTWCSHSPSFRGYTTDPHDSAHARIRQYNELHPTPRPVPDV